MTDFIINTCLKNRFMVLLGTIILALAGVTLVPKLQLGNPESEAPASRDGKLELPKPNSQAGAWELAANPLIMEQGAH